MKPILIILIALLATLIACEQKNVFTDKGFTNKAEAKNKLKDAVKEGKWIEYLSMSGKVTTDSSSPLYRLCVYRDGITFGIVRVFYKDGKLEAEMPYQNGKLNGLVKEYSESGALMDEMPFKEEKEDGVERLYYESGKVSFENTFKDGNPVISKRYYENGILEHITPYTNGLMDGVAKDYYENGKISIETTYKNGKQVSYTTYDDSLGRIISRNDTIFR